VTVLGFEPLATVIDGRRIRKMRFESRSALPISAACVVANGVRELLGELIGAALSLRLLVPLLPDVRAWNAIARSRR